MNLIKLQKKSYYQDINTVGNRVASIVVVFILCLFITVFSVKALREPFINFVVETYEKDVDIIPEGLFYCPAVKIYEEIECAHYDGVTDVLDRNQVYLLTDGDIVLAKSIRMGHGNICSEYKTEIRTITDYEDFCFDEEDLYARLSDIWEGYHDEEDN